jgi:heat shock protein 5
MTLLILFFSHRRAYSLKTELNNKEKLGGKLSNNDKKIIEAAIEKQIEWLESNPGANVNDLKEHKKQLEEVVTPIIAKSHGQDGTGTSDVPPHSSHAHDNHSL